MAGYRQEESDVAKKQKNIGRKPQDLVVEAGTETDVEPVNKGQAGFQLAPPPTPSGPVPSERTGSATPQDIYQQSPEESVVVNGITFQKDSAGNWVAPYDPSRGPEPRGELSKGLTRGVGQLHALGVGAQSAIADFIGNDEYSATRAQDYVRIMEEAQLFNPAEVQSIEDIQSPGQLAAWTAGILGEQIPNIAGYIVSGGIGAVLAKMAGKRLISNTVREQIGNKLQSFGKTGALAGGYTYGAALGTGEVYGEQVGEAGLSVEEGTTRPGAAILGGMTIGALDVLPVVSVANKLGFGKKMRGEILREIAKQSRTRRAFMAGAAVSGQEAGTEALQEVVGIAARNFVDKNYGWLGEEQASRILNAAAAGAVVGGVMGAGGGVVEAQRARSVAGSVEEAVAGGGEVKQSVTPTATQEAQAQAQATPSQVEPGAEEQTHTVDPTPGPEPTTAPPTPEEIGGQGGGEFTLVQPEAPVPTGDPSRNVGLPNDPSLPQNLQNLIEAYNVELNKEGFNVKKLDRLKKKIEERYQALGSESPFRVTEEVVLQSPEVDTKTGDLFGETEDEVRTEPEQTEEERIEDRLKPGERLVETVEGAWAEYYRSMNGEHIYQFMVREAGGYHVVPVKGRLPQVEGIFKADPDGGLYVPKNIPLSGAQGIIESFLRAEQTLGKAGFSTQEAVVTPGEAIEVYDELHRTEDLTPEIIQRVQEQAQNVVNSWANSLGVAAPEVRVENIGSPYGEYGGGRIGSSGVIYLNLGVARALGKYMDLSDPSTKIEDLAGSRAFETLSHEFGHHLHDVLLLNAEQSVQEQIIQDYHNFLSSSKGVSSALKIAMRSAGAKQQMQLINGMLSKNRGISKQYAQSFDEWIADQVSRYLIDKEVEGHSEATRSFFQQLADMLQRVYNFYLEKLMPDRKKAAPSVQVWLDGVRESVLRQYQEELTQTETISATEAGMTEEQVVNEVAGETLNMEGLTPAQRNRLVALSEMVLEGEEISESAQKTLERLQKKARVQKVSEPAPKEGKEDDRDIRNMTAEGPGRGLTIEQVATAIKPLLDALPLAPNVNVVYRQELESDPVLAQRATTAAGLFTTNQQETVIYLIADNIQDAPTAQRAFLHEVVGHGGIRAIFNEQELDRFLKIVRGSDETVSLEEAEERVARMAEKISLQKESQSIFNRVKALVRQALRKITGLAIPLNNAEIEGILINAAGYLKGKKGKTTPYSMWTPEDLRVIPDPDARGGAEDYTKEKIKFINMIKKGENLRGITSRGVVQNKLRKLNLRKEERRALETILDRVPERFVTWGRVIKDLEDLFVPLRVKKQEGRWNFMGDNLEGNLYFDGKTLIGLDVVRGDSNYLADRMVREAYRYAAQRRNNYFRFATGETVQSLGGDKGPYERGAEFLEEHLETQTVERDGEKYKEAEVRFIDDNLPVPEAFEKNSRIIRAMDLPQKDQLLDDAYWLERVSQLGYMKFKQWMMTPLQIVKTTKQVVPETETHIRNVERWYQTKIEIIEQAEKVLAGYTDADGNKHNGLRGRNKDSLARIGQALFQATAESDQAKGGRLTDEDKRRIWEENNLTEEEIQTFNEVDQAFKSVLRRIKRGVMAGEVRRWINELVPESQGFIEQFYNMETGVFNREGFVQEIERLRSANPSQENAILSARNAVLETNNDFNKLEARTYFPYKRFGQYGIKVNAARDFVDEDGREWKKGQIVSFQTYDSEFTRSAAWIGDSQIRKWRNSPNTFVKDTVLTDQERAYLEFPPGLYRYLEDGLNLTDAQKEELNNIYASLSPGKGFAKQLLKRKGVPGFSRDVLRVYASYMFSAANHTARVEWKDALTESLESINTRAQIAESGTIPGMVYNYFQEHLDYIMNPKEEWSKLRAWGFLWYLGFNVKSAMVNLTQVPLVGYPYLAARYGDSNTVSAIAEATKTVSKMMTGKKNHGLTEAEDKFLQALKETGVVDQSQVSSLAEYTEGEALGRVMGSGAGMAQERLMRAAGWLFHHAEIQNRRVMALASYRLNIQKGLDPTVNFEQLVESAKEAVQATQFEYAKWNRPKFMRGRASVIFLFWQYMQQASFLAFGGEGKGTAARYWGIMFAAGGLLGLPFMDDILDLVDYTGTTAKKTLGMDNPHVQSREFLREWMAEYMDNPDLFMNGAGRYYGLGPLHLLSLLGMPVPEVDISGSLSMGDIVPGTTMLARGSGSDPTTQLGRAVEEGAGAVFQIGYNFWKAAASDHPDTYKQWERAMPIALKNLLKAGRLWYRGEETTQDGATFLSYDPNQPDTPSRAELHGELVAQALGFASSRAGVRYDYMMAQMDAITWHQTRRSMLLDDFAWAKQWNDREVLADVRKSIRQYNASVPNPSLKITQDTIRRSLRERRRRQMEKERGLPAQTSYQGLARDIQKGFPEISFD